MKEERDAWLAKQYDAMARIGDPDDLTAALAHEAERLPAGAKIAIALPEQEPPALGACWNVHQIIVQPATQDLLIRATRTITPVEAADRAYEEIARDATSITGRRKTGKLEE